MANKKPKQTSGPAAPPSGAGGIQLPAFAGNVASGGTQSLSGSSSANLNTEVWVPTVPGTTVGLHKETIQDYINGLSPSELGAWGTVLYNLHLSTSPTDTTTLRTALANALYQASKSPDPNHPGSTGTNITDYLTGVANAQQSAPNGGASYARFYKGGTAEVNLTSPGAVQVDGDSVAQQLIGRRLSQQQVSAITSILNSQEYAKGAADIATAQAQQAGYIEAITGGSESGGTAQSNVVAPATAQQLAQLAYNAGFRGSALTTAVAVAMAESSGNTGALNNNPNTGDYSVGAWQINYYGNLNQSRTQQFGSPATLQSDPQAQAQAAYSVSNGGKDFSPWTTYKDGAYQQYMSEAQSAAKSVTSQQPVSITPTSAATGPSNAPAAPTGPPTATQAAQAGQPASTPSTNPIPTLQPLQPGQTAASETVGNAIPFTVGNESYYVMPPTATIVNAPESASQATADYLMNQDSPQFQQQNLMNTFDVIHKMLGGATSNKTGPLQQGLSLP